MFLLRVCDFGRRTDYTINIHITYRKGAINQTWQGEGMRQPRSQALPLGNEARDEGRGGLT